MVCVLGSRRAGRLGTENCLSQNATARSVLADVAGRCPLFGGELGFFADQVPEVGPVTVAISTDHLAFGYLGLHFANGISFCGPTRYAHELRAAYMIEVHLPRSILDAAIGAGPCFGRTDHLDVNSAFTLSDPSEVIGFIVLVVLTTVFPTARTAIGVVDYSIRVFNLDIELIEWFFLSTNGAATRFHSSASLLETIKMKSGIRESNPFCQHGKLVPSR